jgi:hypothetical protein
VDRPHVVGQAQRHGRSALLPGLMGTQEVVIMTPPQHMLQQVGVSVGQRPGFAGQQGDALGQSQVQAFDEGGLDARRLSVQVENLCQVVALAPQHPHGGEDHMTPFATFDQLAVEQRLVDLPVGGSGLRRLDPLSEMGGQGVEIAAQSAASLSLTS